MSLFEWHDSYRIGVPMIDAQHRRLFSLGNELHAAMNAGQSASMLQQVLAKLILYTKTHFAAEERLMQQTGYPDYAAHKAKHDALTSRVVELARAYQAGEKMLSVDTLLFLSQWLRQHVASTDRKYVPLVRRKSAPVDGGFM